MTILGFLIALVVFLAILWVVKTLLAAFSVGEPISSVVWAVVVVIAIVYLISSVSHGGMVIFSR